MYSQKLSLSKTDSEGSLSEMYQDSSRELQSQKKTQTPGGLALMSQEQVQTPRLSHSSYIWPQGQELH